MDGETEQQAQARRARLVPENMKRQRALWRFERIGWVGMFIFVALALAGLFSSGPLSRAQESSADGRASIEYERLLRNGAPSKMIIHVEQQGMLAIEFNNALFSKFSIESFYPAPVSTFSKEGGMAFVFDAQGKGTTIYLTLRPEGIGRVNGRLRTPYGTFEVTPFIYP